MKKSRRINGSPWSKPYCKRSWSVAQRVAHYSRPDPLGGCHIWDGALRRGYGTLRYRGRTLFAHRLAWEAKYGPIPGGMIVRHRCNVRRCVNPDHFVLGTRAENNADIRAANIRLADARVETARVSGPGARPIRIFYDGIELIGDVTIEVVDPR